MLGTYVSRNGQLIPKAEAVIPVDHLEFAYGFGVYENIRLRHGDATFLDKHIDRLFHSAHIIALAHSFTKKDIIAWTRTLLKKNAVDSANIKINLIGGSEPQLFIFLLAPVYVDKKLYRTGVDVIARMYERFLPQAKTLNMLPSYLLYRDAKERGAYDTLLLNREGYILEGTRTNFFAIKSTTLFTAPITHVLAGVTRDTVIECALSSGYTVKEELVFLDDVFTYEGAFLTSTSSKILPIRKIDGRAFGPIPETLRDFMKAYDVYCDARAT